jgi:hypothetical protein
VANAEEKLAKVAEPTKADFQKEQQQNASKPDAQPSEQAKPTPEFLSTPEFQEAVRQAVYPLAQSIADKQVKPLQEKLTQYERQDKIRQDEERIKAQEEAEADQWETEGVSKTSIKAFHDARRDQLRANREVLDNVAKYNNELALAQLVQQMFPAFGSKTLPILQEINERAKSPEHREDLIRMKQTELKALLEAEVKAMFPGQVTPTPQKPAQPPIPTGIPAATGGDPAKVAREKFAKTAPFSDPKVSQEYYDKVLKK